jgi:hypothetical protein
LIAEHLEAVERGEIRRLMVMCPPRHGKALEVTTPIPTPQGWVRIGDLRSGDSIFGDDGRPCRVVAVSPVWRDRPLYRISTKQGAEVFADGEHDWRVRLDRKRPRWIVRNSQYLAARTSPRRALIACQGVLDLPELTLPIDPYVLGVWLGDGHNRQATITQHPDDAVFIRDEFGRRGYPTTDRRTYCTFGVLGDFLLKLRASGVLRNKHVPPQYLRASIAQRLDLLRGLIDTDGHVAPDGQIEYCSVELGLAQSTHELICSLGCKATIIEGRSRLNGVDHGSKYRVMFYMAGAASLPRKAAKCRDGEKHCGHYVKAERVGIGDTVCIQVDSPNRMFLCGRAMLPTHNSELVSRKFPAWYIGRNPHRDVISASYGSDLANDFGRDVRNIVASPEYRELFPQVRLAADSQAKDRWHVSGGGGYVAAGVGTTITGRGAHLFIIDDPVKDRVDAESEKARQDVWDWYVSVAHSRMEKNGAIILCLTRWHEDDLAGRLVSQEAEGGVKWVKLILPAITADGAALWPEKYPLEVLHEIRSLDEYTWASLYEQRPRPLGGSFFSEASLLVDGQPVEMPTALWSTFAIVDTAMKSGKQHDGLAVTYFGLVLDDTLGYSLVVLDWDLKQMEGALLETWLPTVFEYLEALALECRAVHGSRGARIEDKGSGTVLLQQAANHGWDATAIESKLTAMGKSERAINVSGYVHQGQVKFTRRAYERVITFKGTTKNHLLSQILSFRPGSQENASDDSLDTWTYGVSIALGNPDGF